MPKASGIQMAQQHVTMFYHASYHRRVFKSFRNVPIDFSRAFDVVSLCLRERSVNARAIIVRQRITKQQQ
jgi:hypothetical protein